MILMTRVMAFVITSSLNNEGTQNHKLFMVHYYSLTGGPEDSECILTEHYDGNPLYESKHVENIFCFNSNPDRESKSKTRNWKKPHNVFSMLIYLL